MSMSSMTSEPWTPIASDCEPFSNSQPHALADPIEMLMHRSFGKSRGDLGLGCDSKWRHAAAAGAVQNDSGEPCDRETTITVL